MMDRSQLIDVWQREEQQPFIGWDFSYLAGRMLEDQAPWSYSARAAVLLQHATSVVDLGTGGGERLRSLQAHWPQKVVVTEDYPPNYHLAIERLSPMGVHIVQARLTDHDLLPFTDGEFDLVLNRHSAFNPHEVARILTPHGIFFTQQVHGLWAYDLSAAFDMTPQWPNATPQKYIPHLEAAGLSIVRVQDWEGTFTFTDVGAIVYYLKAVPWLVPGFSVATHAHYLLTLQERLDRGDILAFAAKKYVIEAQKREHP